MCVGGWDVVWGVNVMLKRVLSCDDKKGREWMQGEHERGKIYSPRPPTLTRIAHSGYNHRLHILFLPSLLPVPPPLALPLPPSANTR